MSLRGQGLGCPATPQGRLARPESVFANSALGPPVQTTPAAEVTIRGQAAGPLSGAGRSSHAPWAPVGPPLRPAARGGVLTCPGVGTGHAHSRANCAQPEPRTGESHARWLLRFCW